MKILRSRAYTGPNTIAPRPLVHITLETDGARNWPSGAEGEAATQALERLFPAIAAAPAADRAGDAFAARLRQPPGVPLTSVVARIAAELLRLYSGRQRTVGVRRPAGSNLEHIHYDYDDPDIDRFAGEVAVYIALALLPPALRPPSELREGFDPRRARDNYLRQAAVQVLDQTALALLAEARRRDIPWFILHRPRRIVQLGQGRCLRRIRETVTSGTAAIASWIQHDKSATAKVLGEVHLPVPRQGLATSVQAARQAAEQIGYPVVVKPADTGKGKGITLGVGDPQSLEAAFAHARQHSTDVIVESFIPGEDHRVLVVDGRIVAAAKRIPAAVVGDGRRSIAQLVAETNKDPHRGDGFSRLMNRIVLDAQADALLKRRGYTRNSVPPAGETVFLKGTANISTGGTSVDVTDIIHPENATMLRRVARVVGLDVAGIDFITPDIARPFHEVGGAICEVNASPGLRPHQVAALAPGAVQRDVTGPILDMLFPNGGNGRIPTALITGTNGKTTTSRMLAAILRHAGGEIGVEKIGLVTTAGVDINGEVIAHGDYAGVSGARLLLRDPAVDAAVLETARGGIVQSGIAVEWSDVGAVLNVSDDHLGLLGLESLDDLATVKKCVVEAARRLAVLNADDPRCAAMAALKAPAEVCFFTLCAAAERLDDHLSQGGLAIGLEARDGRECLVLHRGGTRETLIAAAEIPATLDGAARHNIANAMAAAGLALGLGLSPAGIAAALAAFKGDAGDNPGRLNVYDGLPFKVVCDAAHNPAGMQVLCDTLRHMPARGRRIAVISGVGIRHGHHIEEVARIVAGQFDVIICSRRGWLPDYADAMIARDFPLEEVSTRLAAAIVAEGVPQENVLAIDPDTAAVDHALAMGRDGDLVVLLTGLVDWTWERLMQFVAARQGAER
ncbi:MAG: cyanophycin synthetase [Kiloniellaceae bacterium]